MRGERVIRSLTSFCLLLFLVIAVFNTINSLFRTTYFDLYQEIEIARYKWDHPVILAILLIAGLICLYYLLQRQSINEKNTTRWALGWAVFVSLGSVLLFRCIAKCDSGLLSEAAMQFLQGDYRAFEPGEYLYMYPFQLGYLAFMELLYKLFGVENYMVFELLNVVCVADMVWLSGKITEELFEDKKVCQLERILSMGMFPLFLLATFIYGDIPGWCLGLNAVYLTIRYLHNDRWQELCKASVWLSIGIAIKSNLYIVLIAMVIAVIFHAIEKKNRKILLLIGEVVLVSQLGMWIINGIYEIRTGYEIPEGIPKIAWVAMGMQGTNESSSTSGWYNGYNWTVYADCGYDRDATAAMCGESIRESAGRFVRSPRYALLFFYDKYTSQWNDPTFMSLLTNEWYSRNEEPQSDAAVFLLYGAGREALSLMMNFYHFLLYFGTAAGAFCIFKRWRPDKVFLVLIILGGILFHMLWEAKARYALFYFILMLPLAAYGCYQVMLTVKDRATAVRGRRTA